MALSPRQHLGLVHSIQAVHKKLVFIEVLPPQHINEWAAEIVKHPVQCIHTLEEHELKQLRYELRKKEEGK